MTWARSFPFYSCRYRIGGLKRLSNLPKITEVVGGAGRVHALVCWAPTSRLFSVLPVTSHKVQIAVIALCQHVDHTRGVQACLKYKALLCYVRSKGSLEAIYSFPCPLNLTCPPPPELTFPISAPSDIHGQPPTVEAALLSG